MGKYAIKQPNGLYCYYADSLHQIWAYNMNIEQLIAYNAQTWGKTLTEAKEDVHWMLENPIYNYEEMLEDWSWHDEEIEVQMNADPSAVEPCYLAQQQRNHVIWHSKLKKIIENAVLAESVIQECRQKHQTDVVEKLNRLLMDKAQETGVSLYEVCGTYIPGIISEFVEHEPDMGLRVTIKLVRRQ